MFCGLLGVGKFILINKFLNKEYMEIGKVSDKLGRGKYIIRYSEFIDVEDGYIVDILGFLILEIKDLMDKDLLKYCFFEFIEYNDKCKYRGCLYYKEFKCVLKEVFEEGKINKYRYDFYVKILEEIMEGEKNKW